MPTTIPLDSFHYYPPRQRIDHSFGVLIIDDDGQRTFRFRYCEDGWETEVTAKETGDGFHVIYTYPRDRTLRDIGLARVEQPELDEWVLDIDGKSQGKTFERIITAMRRAG